MTISEASIKIEKSLSEKQESLKATKDSSEKLGQEVEVLEFKKGYLDILNEGKVVNVDGIGTALDYIMFFDRNGYSAIPKELVKKVAFVSEDVLNIVPLSELMTVPCPNCGSQSPYMQRVFPGHFVTSGEFEYSPIVIHCGDVRKIEHIYINKKLKDSSP
jgi:hypothetical protein